MSQDLDEYQQRAVEMAQDEKVMVLTGGPGTGKTWTINAILQDTNAEDIALAAPTGKAAKRMKEATHGHEAKTIHRLLEYSPSMGGFQRDSGFPLDHDLIIIDETSMLDTWLAAQLLSAITPGTQLIFVGDKDQLPSVGAGKVFKDIIESKTVPVIELEEIHRQSEHSWIPHNARAVNNGVAPTMDPDSEDFFIHFHEDKEEAREKIIELMTETIPDRFQIGPEDIQLLCPQKPGALGCKGLNPDLQEILNPAQGREEYYKFHVGDKVIHLRNNYDLGVFNGEVGMVDMIDKDFKTLAVDYFDRIVTYNGAELEDLALAYALTIHKSQGSEWPIVVLPLHTTNTHMLSRNLAYTAITRGKTAVYIVANRKGLALAVKKDDAQRRFTGLNSKLRKAFND